MKKNTTISDQSLAPVPKVEYDGYYLIDVVARNGFQVTIPARGYDLKSWLNFERNLGSTVEYRAVDQQEWMKLHWTQTPYEEDSPGFAILARKAAKKVTEKAAAKNKPAYPADDGPLTAKQIKQIKKTAPKPVVKKTAKKAATKKPPAKK
jgi:hypothetical protein